MDTFVLGLLILCYKVRVYKLIFSKWIEKEWQNNIKTFSIIFFFFFFFYLNKLKFIVMFAINISNLKKLKYILFKKHQVFPLFTVSVIMNMKKYLKKKNQLK